MSNLDRIKKLSGILNEDYQYDMTDKGDMHDALGDVQISMDDAVKNIQKANNLASQVSDEIEKTLYTDESVQEAVGDSAECFYDLQDEYCGEQCPSMPHKILIDELVRYLSGDQLQDFCDDFRRHHMDGMEESNDLNELKTLAGLEEMGTVDMDRYDRNKKTKLKLPLSPELERLKKLGIDFKNYVTPGDGKRELPTYELPDMPDDGRLETPGYYRDRIRDLPLTPGPQKDDGRFPGGEPERIELPKGVEIKYPKPKFPMPGTDDIERRIDRIKAKPKDMYKFK